MTIHRKKLPIAALERIDDHCAEFERGWQSSQPPTIESIVTNDLPEGERELLLSELLALEIDYRRRKGEAPALEDYVDRFPEDVGAIREALGIEKKQGQGFEPPSVEQISKLFPELEIVELLGSGGMGAVYKARQRGLDRFVALKILPEEFGHDVKFALRFTREARTLARLNHPNIVSVFEFGNVDDIYFFLMEYVDGSTLRDVVRSGELAPEHALAIVPKLCDALQYAHDQAVVHRDIKPENILMGKDGSVKIADFGLSRIVANENQATAQTALTQAHQVLGTPRYMAPEQLEGSHRVDHRADIYSLGVVFYEMLTGELPIGRFEAPSHKVQIDVRLDEVVLRTLEKEPQRRYQAASAIKSDLQSIAQLSTPPRNRSSHEAEQFDTVEHMSGKHGMPVPTASLQQQETAARLLLSRRELMDRVKASLRPLHRGQIIQILVGVLLILMGAMCWTQNIGVPHRVICGVILHVYGIGVIASAAFVCTRISRVDYSQPVAKVREMLDRARRAYLMTGPVIGFPWWLMWIPVCVAIGFDAVMYPSCLWVAFAIGIPGLAISLWLYLRVLNSTKDSAKRWHKQFAGESLSRAYMTLDEIERARID